jgi:hypothetical protein
LRGRVAEHVEHVDVSDLPSGVYQVILSDSYALASRPVLVLR